MSVQLGCLLAFAFAVGAGCAAAPAQPAAADDGRTRLILTWHQPLPDDGASLSRLDAELSRLAGAAVRQVATVDERVSAITVDCRSATECRDAADRLRADRRVIDLVADRRRGHHRNPSSPFY